jgi:malonyl-CoA O-methyltransferase
MTAMRGCNALSPGFLTEALIEQGIAGDWLITDIAPAMIERCRARVGALSDADESRRFALLDGEYGGPGDAGPFDLVCSSLVMQWFDDPASGLNRMLGWLAPGGHCLLATLASGSFAEWRDAHEAEGLPCGTPRFCETAEMKEQHEGALDFLHSLKAIGANTAAAGHRPLPPADLRRVMQRFEEQGASVTYEVVTGHFRRLPAPAE